MRPQPSCWARHTVNTEDPVVVHTLWSSPPLTSMFPSEEHTNERTGWLCPMKDSRPSSRLLTTSHSRTWNQSGEETRNECMRSRWSGGFVAEHKVDKCTEQALYHYSRLFTAGMA